jgi:hypothetical protein
VTITKESSPLAKGAIRFPSNTPLVRQRLSSSSPAAVAAVLLLTMPSPQQHHRLPPHCWSSALPPTGQHCEAVAAWSSSLRVRQPPTHPHAQAAFQRARPPTTPSQPPLRSKGRSSGCAVSPGTITTAEEAEAVAEASARCVWWWWSTTQPRLWSGTYTCTAAVYLPQRRRTLPKLLLAHSVVRKQPARSRPKSRVMMSNRDYPRRRQQLLLRTGEPKP